MRGPACAALALALAACGGEESAERPGATGDRAARSAAGELAEVRRAWPVMGTLLEVVAWHPDSAAAAAAIHSARAAVTAVDSLMSNYRADSELSLLNRRAGGAERTPVSEWTARVLAASLEWGEASGGAFDVTVGPVVDVWGFYRERGAIPAPATLDSATSLVGHRGIDYDAAGASARLTRPGMRLDLGAIAKGFAVDRALDALGAAGVAAAMVDLGGNVGVLGASPSAATDAAAGAASSADGWRVGIRDPRAPESLAAVVTLADGASTASSGDYERFFEVDGVRYAHIVDPRSGLPARGVAAVSVIAPSGMDADALSTTLYVLGPGRGACLLETRPGAGALWFLDDGGSAERPLTALVAGERAGAFSRAGESQDGFGVASADDPARAFERARCTTEG